MSRKKWQTPLAEGQVKALVSGNTQNGLVEVIYDGPIGSMVVVHCTEAACGSAKGKIFYHGGDYDKGQGWIEESIFLLLYPDFKQGRRVMPDPEFDLDDMELAEIIIEEDSKIEDLKK